MNTVQGLPAAVDALKQHFDLTEVDMLTFVRDAKAWMQKQPEQRLNMEEMLEEMLLLIKAPYEFTWEFPEGPMAHRFKRKDIYAMCTFLRAIVPTTTEH